MCGAGWQHHSAGRGGHVLPVTAPLPGQRQPEGPAPLPPASPPRLAACLQGHESQVSCSRDAKPCRYCLRACDKVTHGMSQNGPAPIPLAWTWTTTGLAKKLVAESVPLAVEAMAFAMHPDLLIGRVLLHQVKPWSIRAGKSAAI